MITLMASFVQRWFGGPSTRPTAGARSVAEEAAEVRALADSYRQSDPGFASDLYAAVERYERAAEGAVSAR